MFKCPGFRQSHKPPVPDGLQKKMSFHCFEAVLFENFSTSS
jgi:hypothetical protein